MSARSKPPKANVNGDEIWKSRMEKVVCVIRLFLLALKQQNAELFTLTYGSIVLQLFKDHGNWIEVNKQLDKMFVSFNLPYHSIARIRGHNIGVRLIEEFLAKSGAGKCQDFKETVEMITKVGFKMFLGISPTISGGSADGKEFNLIFDENPLAEFVELPEDATKDLW